MRRAWLAALVVCTCRLFGQPAIGSWVTYTGMNAATAVSIGGNTVAAATTGGFFLYDTLRQEFRRFNSSHGLPSNDLLSVFVAPDGSVWTGASDGSVACLTADGTAPRPILGIRDKGSARPAVRQFVQTGDSLLIVWESGVSVYLADRNLFGDTYANFGFASQPVVTCAAVRPGRIWVGTDQGIATASRGSGNLMDPASWTILSSVAVRSLAVIGDSIYAGTAAGVSAGTWTGSPTLVGALTGLNVTALRGEGTLLYALSGAGTSFRIDRWDAAAKTASTILANSQEGAASIDVRNGQLAIATTEGGVLAGSAGSMKRLRPPGPASNRFVALTVDDRGVLWAASGAANGKGLYSFRPDEPEDRQWKNFSTASYPAMRGDSYYRVVAGPEGRIWAGSWGTGVIELAGDTVRRRIDATTVPSVSGTNIGTSDTNFVVSGLAGVDGDGSILIPVSNPLNGNVITRLTGESTVRAIRCGIFGSEGQFVQGIVVDRNRTKWIINSEPTYRHGVGLLYYNETTALPGTTDGWGVLTSPGVLPSPNVLSVAEDQSGEIWVGTFAGAVVIRNPLRPSTQFSSVFTLKDRMVQSIAVDGLNNKWAATKEGVFVFNADATQVLAEYSVATTNGKLADNDVRALAIDQKRGIVYFGTEKGLSALRIAAINPDASFSSLLIAPNPYLVPSDRDVEIRNLVANSSIKILTPSGHVVAEFKAQGGGRALWNGRDSRGGLVGSGMYFVVAYADNGNQVTAGKLAVVRR